MIVKALHPNIEGNPRSSLTVKALLGQTSLVVQNGVDFAADDYVVNGNPTEELTEIKKITSISGKTITLSSNLINTHPVNTRIQVIKYNQVKFYKASSINGSYTLVATKDIAIDEPHTLYDDPTALSTDYFKIKYYNAQTGTLSVFSDPIGTSGFPRYSLVRIQDALFKRSGDSKRQFLDADEMTDWVNEIKDDMVNQIIDSCEKYLNTSEDLNVDVNGEADLTERFRKINQVLVYFNGVNGFEARKIEREKIDDNSQRFSEVYPCHYFDSYKIGIRPKGNVGTTFIRILFEEQPADLENDSDELPKPIRFYMGVVMDGLMAKTAEKAGKVSQADRYWTKYNNGTNLMLEEINNLVLNENRSVNDETDDDDGI
jgi:hypothetical protein